MQLQCSWMQTIANHRHAVVSDCSMNDAMETLQIRNFLSIEHWDALSAVSSDRSGLSSTFQHHPFLEVCSNHVEPIPVIQSNGQSKLLLALSTQVWLASTIGVRSVEAFGSGWDGCLRHGAQPTRPTRSRSVGHMDPHGCRWSVDPRKLA